MRRVLDPKRVTMRDAMSYCGVPLDDNNRKPICRLHFNRAQKYIGLFGEDKSEDRVPIDSVDDIFGLADQLRATAASRCRCEPGGGRSMLSEVVGAVIGGLFTLAAAWLGWWLHARSSAAHDVGGRGRVVRPATTDDAARGVATTSRPKGGRAHLGELPGVVTWVLCVATAAVAWGSELGSIEHIDARPGPKRC